MFQANSEKKRQQGIINKSYALGKQRLDLQQGDERQSQGEGLLARGLGGGGSSIADTGSVSPTGPTGVGGAHDLGGQQVADERREQTLQQSSMLQEKNNALSDSSAQATQGFVNSIGSGIATGAQAFSAGSAASHWGGIDAVNPLGSGSWQKGTQLPDSAGTVDNFHVQV